MKKRLLSVLLASVVSLSGGLLLNPKASANTLPVKNSTIQAKSAINTVTPNIITTPGHISGNGVRIRATASTSGTILGQVNSGDTVAVTNAMYSASWVQIWYNGRYAYVSAQYVYFG